MYDFPPKMLAALTEFAALSSGQVRELSEFVAAHLEDLRSPEAAFERSESFKSIQPTSAFRILDGLVPMIFGSLASAKDSVEVVADLVGAYERGVIAAGDTPIGAAQLKRLRSNLVSVLDNPATKLKSKTIRLLNSQERPFASCEILSDIRPVFSANGKMKIEAAVFFHTLRLVHGFENEEFYISLDSKDLQTLKAAIDRAVEKEKALSGFIRQSGVEHIKVS